MNQRDRRSSTTAKIPVWLRRAEQFLDKRQKQFIVDVYSRIQLKIQSLAKTSEYRVNELKEISDSLTVTFEAVIKHLQIAPSSKHFLEKYPKWQFWRNRNTTHLRQIADRIDKQRQDSKHSKAFGCIVSLVGGGIALAAGGTASKLFAGTMMGLGAVCSTAALDREEKLLRENLEEAKHIVEREKECFKNLVEWLADVSKLQQAVDDMESINYGGNFIGTAKKLENFLTKNFSEKQIENEIERLLENLKLSPEVGKEVAEIVGILLSFYMILKRNSHIFKLAIQGKNTLSALRLSVELFHAAYVGMESVSTVAKCNPLTTAQKKKIGAGMIVDAFYLLYVVSQDPKSVEAVKIREIAFKLEEEAKEFQKYYESIVLTLTE